jgi:hypothetical protein
VLIGHFNLLLTLLVVLLTYSVSFTLVNTFFSFFVKLLISGNALRYTALTSINIIKEVKGDYERLFESGWASRASRKSN